MPEELKPNITSLFVATNGIKLMTSKWNITNGRNGGAPTMAGDLRSIC